MRDASMNIALLAENVCIAITRLASSPGVAFATTALLSSPSTKVATAGPADFGTTDEHR